jgi:hypothetical protein
MIGLFAFFVRTGTKEFGCGIEPYMGLQPDYHLQLLGLEFMD